MKKRLFLVTAISFLLLPLSANAAIKCWTNSEGVRECGNTIPPEYSQQSSKTINERGMTIETQERALTKEELAIVQQREEEERRLVQAEEKKQKEQATADRVLLSTFLSEDEIIGARDRKLLLIDGNIEITNVTINKLNDDLQRERKKAANYERKGKTVPEATLKELESLERQVKNKQDFILAKEAEKEVIREKYARDLERFRELKLQGKRLK